MSTKIDIFLEGAPQRIERQYETIFTTAAKHFLWEFIAEFDGKVEQILLEREKRRIEIAKGNWQPTFESIEPSNWKITDIPQRIQNRKLDLGDISPANTFSFTDALFANVQGIQVN